MSDTLRIRLLATGKLGTLSHGQIVMDDGTTYLPDDVRWESMEGKTEDAFLVVGMSLPWSVR